MCTYRRWQRRFRTETQRILQWKLPALKQIVSVQMPTLVQLWKVYRYHSMHLVENPLLCKNTKQRLATNKSKGLELMIDTSC